MAQGKKSFVLYCDQKVIFEQLPLEKRGELITILFEYVNDENPKVEDALLNMAFTLIKQQLKRDLKKFESVKEKRALAGKKSAEKRAEQKATKSTRVKSVQQSSTNPTVNDNDNDNDNVNDNVIVTEKQVLEIFKKARIKKGLQFNVKKLTYMERANLNLLNDYTLENFELAIGNALDNKWVIDNSQGFPAHVLKPEQFTKYLNTEVKKPLTLGQIMNGAE
jgi:hypothetical protein